MDQEWMGVTAKEEVQLVKMVRYMVIYSPIDMVWPALLNPTMHTNATKLILTFLFAYQEGQKIVSQCISCSSM